MKESWGLSAERITSCALALLMSTDVKFVNTFQRNAQYFNTYSKISPYIGNKFAVDNHRDIFSREIYSRQPLNVDNVYNRSCSVFNPIFALSSHLTVNIFCVIKTSFGINASLRENTDLGERPLTYVDLRAECHCRTV